MYIKETETKDLDNVLELWNNGRTMFFVGFPNGLGTTIEAMQSWHKRVKAANHVKHFSVYSSEDCGDYIGELFYEVNEGIAVIDIKLLPTHWNHGYGTKMLTWLIETIFETTDATKCIVDPHKGNTQALKLYNKVGFEVDDEIVVDTEHIGLSIKKN